MSALFGTQIGEIALPLALVMSPIVSSIGLLGCWLALRRIARALEKGL